METNAHIDDLIVKCRGTWQDTYTDFLDPVTWQAAVRSGLSQGVFAESFGGFEEAERRQVRFYMEDSEADWPMSVLSITWQPRYGNPTHRDILGSVLGLGLDRSALGDILVGEGEAFLFCNRTIEKYILDTYERAGRVSVRVAKGIFDAVEYLQDRSVSKTINVQSLRLDAVICAAYGLSRSRTQKLIENGLAKVDFLPETDADTRLTEGSLVSLKGYGRFKVMKIGGQSRKGRLYSEIKIMK